MDKSYLSREKEENRFLEEAYELLPKKPLPIRQDDATCRYLIPYPTKTILGDEIEAGAYCNAIDRCAKVLAEKLEEIDKWRTNYFDDVMKAKLSGYEEGKAKLQVIDEGLSVDKMVGAILKNLKIFIPIDIQGTNHSLTWKPNRVEAQRLAKAIRAELDKVLKGAK